MTFGFKYIAGVLAICGCAVSSYAQGIQTHKTCHDYIKKGRSTIGYVVLTEPAPPGGLTVTLSRQTTLFTLGVTSLFLNENQEAAQYNIGTNGTTAVTSTLGATISGGLTSLAALSSTTLENDNFCSVPDRVRGGGTAGMTGYINVSTTAPSPGGTVISLASSDPSVASVPSSVTIPALTNSVTFGITTYPVSTPTSVTITATSIGLSMTSDIVILPPTIHSIATNTSNCSNGGTITGTAKILGKAPVGGTVVTLTSSDPSATVPASVTISYYNSTANFTISCGSVGAPTAVSISGEVDGRVKSKNITVNP